MRRALSNITAVFLVGGRGKRLRPLTDTIPKPLIEIDGTTAFGETLQKLYYTGFKNCFVIGHYKFELFKSYQIDSQINFENLVFIRELIPKGTGGALNELPSSITSDILVVFGDIFWEKGLDELLQKHFSEKNTVTLGLTTLSQQVPYGIITEYRGRVESFKERPRINYKTFAGIAALKTDLLKVTKEWSTFGFDAIINYALESRLSVSSSEIVGWRHLETIDSFKKKPIDDQS